MTCVKTTGIVFPEHFPSFLLVVVVARCIGMNEEASPSQEILTLKHS